MTWRGRITRELLTGAGYGALAEDIVAAVDATWPEGARPATAPAHHDVPAPPAPPAKTPPEEREYLSIATLAHYTCLSKSTIRNLLKGPDPIPSFLVGRSRRFSRQQVDIWMNRRRMAAPVGVDDVLTELRGRR